MLFRSNARLDPTLDVYATMKLVFTPALDAMQQMEGLQKQLAADPHNAELTDKIAHCTAVVDAMDAYNMDTQIKKVLNGMGFPADTWTKAAGVLSGGEQTRLRLARLLLERPDLLILDEPTNHIDNEMAIWLEDYLNRFRGVVIMVTHDRYFLDRVTNKILEISHGKLYSYVANYSKFLEMKAQREEMELATERKRQSVLRMELEWAKRGCRARSTKQRARLERLEALKAGKAPVTDQNVELDSIGTRMGKKTIELHHVSKSYGEKRVIDDFDYIVLKNQRLTNSASPSALASLNICCNSG